MPVAEAEIAVLAKPIEVTKIEEHLPGALVSYSQDSDNLRVTVERDQIVDVLTLMRDDLDLAYNFFSECLGVDYLDLNGNGLIMGKTHRFEVVYNLYAFKYVGGIQVGRNQRVFIKIGVPDSDPVVPTVTSVYSGAGWPEREIYDMFGIQFAGHADLRRILMSDDWVGHPQRKDYPLGGERVQFPDGKYGPAVGDGVVQHPGESFFGKTASETGEGD